MRPWPRACQQRRRALGAKELGFEVGVQDRIPLDFGGFREWRRCKDRGVIDEDVEAAEALFGAFKKAGNFIGAR